MRLAWIRGRLENSQGNISQPVEIDNLGDEQPPQLEGGENEKELEENDEGEHRDLDNKVRS